MQTPTVNRVELPLLKPERSPSGAALGLRVELVEHVAVELNVRLGNAELPISELFDLAPGAVVALDRDLDAPVDLELNGRVVARGYLVAVGDRFGVRIS